MTDPLPNPDSSDRDSQPVAGGIFIVMSLIVGVIAGIAFGQPSAGMVGGLLVGIGIAVTIWLVDRRRA